MISLLKTVIFERHSPGVQALVPQPESRLLGGAPCFGQHSLACSPWQAGAGSTHALRMASTQPFRGSEGKQSFQRGACSCILLTDANEEVCLPLEIISSATKLALICCF